MMSTEMNPHVDTLAAWADGERVNREAVLLALADTNAREYVVDLMALRQVVMRTTPQWATGTVSSASTVRSRFSWQPVALAASLALCAAGGFVAGRGLHGVANSGTVVAPAVVAAPQPQSAPHPTHVIQLKSGVDWRENFGGN